VCGDPVNHGAGDQSLADGSIRAPTRAMLEQVMDGNREVMIRVHQPYTGRDNAVSVIIGVVAESDIEAVL